MATNGKTGSFPTVTSGINSTPQAAPANQINQQSITTAQSSSMAVSIPCSSTPGSSSSTKSAQTSTSGGKITTILKCGANISEAANNVECPSCALEVVRQANIELKVQLDRLDLYNQRRKKRLENARKRAIARHAKHVASRKPSTTSTAQQTDPLVGETFNSRAAARKAKVLTATKRPQSKESC